MGWFNAYSTKILTTTSGKYALYPLERGILSPGLLAIRVEKNATETYYFSYRQQRGPFGEGADSYLGKVNVHRTREGENRTLFIKALGSKESFIDTANHVKVTVLSLGQTARIEINNFN